MLDVNALNEALGAVGDLLEERGEHIEVVAIGGGGLILLGLIERSTIDLDLVGVLVDGRLTKASSLPKPLADAASDVARVMNLVPTWINAGPAAMLDLGLPEGFLTRTTRREFGGLVVHLASRFDQICFKLYAAADDSPRGKHFADLKQLVPTRDEVAEAAAWTITHDPSPGFRTILDQVVEALNA